MPLPLFRAHESRRRILFGGGLLLVAVLVTLGVFASNDWFPRTDPFSGKRYGWFGKPLAKNAQSAWNPFPMPSPTPTPTPYQLSKELIYAGSRLLTVEDKNASAVPPADLAIWRPGATGVWWVRISGESWVTQNWGTTGDIPVPGDYDGDGTTDFSVLRENFEDSGYNRWFIIRSSDGGFSIYDYSIPGDIPAQADYDGDGKTDSAIFRPSNYTWYIQGSSVGFYYQAFGATTDIPAPADHDGDGKADLAVFRPSTRTFYSFGSAVPGMTTVSSGISSGSYSWELVSSDYDGDGKADYAVFDRTAANWYIRPSGGGSGGFSGSPNGDGFMTFQWGDGGDKAVHNDYDSDGKTDLAVWTNSGTNEGRWHIRKSSDASTRNDPWGQSGDIPVPAYYRR